MIKNLLLIFILVVSLFLNLYGIQWGLPMHWYPDEYETIEKTVIPMTRNLDLNPHYFFKPSLYYYFLCFVMAPYFLYIKTTGIQIESYQNQIIVAEAVPDVSQEDSRLGMIEITNA